MATSPRADHHHRLDKRPSLQSQHSISVPTTPYQRPTAMGGLRFHSRSPSPSRAIGNRSPRSAVSEAVGSVGGPQRSMPAVCKYETGDEIRKRRIPYVEGGNEELGSPKEEPKKTLEPEEKDKLSGDMRELYDRLLPSHESEERRTKLIDKLHRILNDEWPGQDIRVNVFGSSGNLLSSTDSDVDICITTPLKKIESMHSLASLLARHGMEKVVCRAAAKVPIVKCWDPELQLAADLNVNNTLALQNTRMIKTYVQLDSRVRPLAKIIKYWTKRRILNDAAYGGTISSYTWICMVISFLQRRHPPILPSLQKIPEGRGKSDAGEPSPFADDLDAIKGLGDANKESLGELLFQFFRHYGYEFEYSKFVVSVKEGRLLSRKEKGWEPSNYHDKEARNRLCVEEPFTPNRNLGNSADDYAWHGIHGEIRRAFELLADGCQLEKCCEQYEFPLEEKPIFQKPVPKPKPTLTRSASQSGRSSQEPGSGRSSRKNNNRNQSSQRPNNRRASSGASFSNQRMSLPFSPPLSTPGDYFAVKGNLHEQLYQQYRFLQAQEDALRSQLAQQTQAHAQAQAQVRAGDLTGSPRSRPYTNGVSSPRYYEPPLPTAPLLPGYLFHYAARHPPSSPMSQVRTREGSSTNPSSPSLSAAVPALRRQVQRASAADGSASSGRSQSQPGRSLPHPLTLQQQAHPGFDVSGAIGSPYQSARAASMFVPGPNGMPVPLQPFAMPPASGGSLDSAMPKEYVGYYVGQSPQLGPQFALPAQMHPPPMTLRDPPPQRPRRVTPDLMPPVLNGRHSSRSPSPLGHVRSFSTAVDSSRAEQGQAFSSPSSYSQAARTPPTVPPDLDLGRPVIVNGSNGMPVAKPMERASSGPGLGQALENEIALGLSHDEHVRPRPLPLRTDFGRMTPPERTEPSERRRSSPATSPKSMARRLSSKMDASPSSAPQHLNGSSDHFSDSAPLTAPLLSPVAELRTPSPTHSRTFDNQVSPQSNGDLQKAPKIPNVWQTERAPLPKFDAAHERKGSLQMPKSATAKPTGANRSPTDSVTSSTLINANPWQQATRKGHKKSKSFAAPRSPPAAGGQPIPANESERKGG